MNFLLVTPATGDKIFVKKWKNQPKLDKYEKKFLSAFAYFVSVITKNSFM